MELTALMQSLSDDGPLMFLVTLFLLSVFTGLLVPKKTVDARISDKEKEIKRLLEDNRDWKTAYSTQTEANQKLQKTNSQLVEIAQVVEQVLQALPRPTYDKARLVVPVESGEDDEP